MHYNKCITFSLEFPSPKDVALNQIGSGQCVYCIHTNLFALFVVEIKITAAIRRPASKLYFFCFPRSE